MRDVGCTVPQLSKVRWAGNGNDCLAAAMSMFGAAGIVRDSEARLRCQ